jgi:LAO/AO transport system kinase
MTISPADWAVRIQSGDARALAKAATEVENHGARASALLAALPSTGALIVGITGPPGAGKSTLTDQLCRELRAHEKRVAILAVDPSSPVTGGALLGDRIRMTAHHGDSGVFVRSLATRGALGGLARATRDLAHLFDGAGFDCILIETVGVGQAEVEIASLAHVVLVVLAPGMGDDIQASKAGLLEIADLFAVNKADLGGAESLVQQLHAEHESIPILKTSATTGDGIAELLAALLAHPRREPRAAEPDAFQIDHLGVAVPSVDAALEFWSKQLGLPLTLRETVAQERVNVAMLDCSPSRVELLEAADPESVIARYLGKRGPGIHHVALRVRDFAGTVDRLRAGGARLLNEPRQGAGGHTYVFVHPESTGGVLLELIAEETYT